MTRCDYDTIFQRVFCVTLIAIAFTFTVILTNVFVDIDGLLSRKDKGSSAKPLNNPEPVFDNEKHVKPSMNDLSEPEYLKKQRNYDSNAEDSYRSKRSLESQNFLFHIRNPKMKSILTSRLATLLEELDDEESTATVKTNSERPEKDKELDDMTKDVYPELKSDDPPKVGKIRRESSNTEEDLLHLAMHNILLQGIIGHMDLNEVYRKVHLLINNFKKTEDRRDDIQPKKQRNQIILNQEIPNRQAENRNRDNIENFDNKLKVLDAYENIPRSVPRPSAEENKFFKEMAECDKLKTDVKKIELIQKPAKMKNTKKQYPLPNVLIKTIIDITSLNKSKTHNQENNDSNERVKGIIQLIYNGRSIKFSRMEEETKDIKKINENAVANLTEPKETTEKSEIKPIRNTEINDATELIQESNMNQHKPDSFLNNLLSEYLKKDPEKVSNFLQSIDARQKYKAKRYKRQIKIRYQDTEIKKKKPKSKKISLAKTDDDELYVEIETHFDSKGMKGEKKKKLIRNLIDKIQKAIQSDIDLLKENKKKKHKRYHVKKRMQYPLDKNRTLFVNEVTTPTSNLIARHSDPIGKTFPSAVTTDEALPSITDKSGENWRKRNFGPSFLTVSKSVNSAELGEVDIDYNHANPNNNIPQRLQKPLNTDGSEEAVTLSSIFDMGSSKFFIKNLDGTGLSIGFNQYTDESPDPESMNFFSGIENLIKAYNEHNNIVEKPNEEDKREPLINSIEKENHNVKKRDIIGNNKQHIVIRRSIKELNEKDYHSNEYKIIFDGKFLPYDNYEEVIEDNDKKIALRIDKENENTFSVKEDTNLEKFRNKIKINELPTLMGDNIFYKKLKPSEILNLATLLNRKKRGINVGKLTNIKRKIKLNKYINRRGRFSPGKLILSKKRSKRQIDKIRIYATDAMDKQSHKRGSDENVFLMSDENLLADRAIVREVETPENALGEMAMREENVENFQESIPIIYQDPPAPSPFFPFNPYNNNYKMNNLMSKYPHIIMEEISKSNEESDQFLSKLEPTPPKHINLISRIIESTTEPNIVNERPVPNLPNLEDMLSAAQPQRPKQNYKLTVKIIPKNITNDQSSGFKEIHTSINKSFNRNGVVYSSLYNVSQISKVENLNHQTSTQPTTTQSTISIKPYLTKRLEEQQAKIDLILRQHKRRIDEQLSHLNKERSNLDKLTIKNAQIKPKEYSEEVSNKNLLVMPPIDINQLIAVMKLTTQNDMTPQLPTTMPTTTTVNADEEKHTLLNTIRRNENLTSEILQQINRNTKILQVFLSKLTEKLPLEINKAKDVKNVTEDKPKVEETDKLWKTFNLEMPYANIQPPHNDTHPPIPFVYAFHHPYPKKIKSTNTPITSVVYYGHIHTNALKGSKEVWKSLEDGKNQTKYFIDDLVNGFKEVTDTKEGAKEILQTAAPNTASSTI